MLSSCSFQNPERTQSRHSRLLFFFFFLQPKLDDGFEVVQTKFVSSSSLPHTDSSKNDTHDLIDLCGIKGRTRAHKQAQRKRPLHPHQRRCQSQPRPKRTKMTLSSQGRCATVKPPHTDCWATAFGVARSSVKRKATDRVSSVNSFCVPNSKTRASIWVMSSSRSPLR